VLDDADLETNVLEFAVKSFSYERTVEIDGIALALFHRRETETESQFRPKVIDLWIAFPRTWVIYDLAADLLRLGRDGHTPGPRLSGTAVEAAAQASQFDEQGISWRRAPVKSGGFLYAPRDLADRLASKEGLRALGLAPV
jgi:hypothetical protein